MRKTIGLVLGLALLATSTTALAAPELMNIWFFKNSMTGDYAASSCETMTGYTKIAVGQMYRDSGPGTCYDVCYNSYGLPYDCNPHACPPSNAGTPCAAKQVYNCYRNVTVTMGTKTYTKKDLYISTDPGCRLGTKTGSMGYALTTACDSEALQLILCQYLTRDNNGSGAQWYEYRVSVGSTCASGGTLVETIGYARAENPVNEQSWGDGCDMSCFGECGAKCDGILGTHYSTSACRSHDQCVVDHGCNAYALACLGDFIVAAVSWAVKAIVGIFKSVIKAIKKFFSKIF